MTLVCLQHPFLVICFLLSGICVVFGERLSKFRSAAALATGISGAATVIGALVCGVPMQEILGLLAILLLAGFLSLRKEEDV